MIRKLKEIRSKSYLETSCQSMFIIISFHATYCNQYAGPKWNNKWLAYAPADLHMEISTKFWPQWFSYNFQQMFQLRIFTTKNSQHALNVQFRHSTSLTRAYPFVACIKCKNIYTITDLNEMNLHPTTHTEVYFAWFR